MLVTRKQRPRHQPWGQPQQPQLQQQQPQQPPQQQQVKAICSFSTRLNYRLNRRTRIKMA
jgi:hypothetical protein